jgi:flagellar motor switch protein FliN/FliY
MPEKDVLSQDDIDSLLAEMQQDEKAAGANSARPAAPADPNLDPAAWGLSEEDLKTSRAAAPAEPAAPAEAPPRRMPMESFDRQGPAVAVPRTLEFVLDIPLVLSVEVGRTRMTIGELLTLGPGSIVELQKLAGEPLEVLVNNKLVARGEAVIVNEKFGVRLTDVISKSERIETLK